MQLNRLDEAHIGITKLGGAHRPAPDDEAENQIGIRHRGALTRDIIENSSLIEATADGPANNNVHAFSDKGGADQIISNCAARLFGPYQAGVALKVMRYTTLTPS